MYFDKFPKFLYDFDINNKRVAYRLTDITHNVRVRKQLLENVSLYDTYDIVEGETPEIIAEKFYGNPEYHWIIMLANNMYDYKTDFPLEYNTLQKYIDDKYALVTTPNSPSAIFSLSNGVMTVTSSGVPFHSYGNPKSKYTPSAQDINVSFSCRGGTNIPALTSTTVGAGTIGYAINGVSLYNPTAQLGSSPIGINQYYPQWEYNASYSAELSIGYSFGQDLAGGHTDAPNIYHYHDFSFTDAWKTGIGATSKKAGVAELSILPYLNDSLVHTDGHSKIIGFAIDGYPIYGPYGYSNPLVMQSGVKLMGSGYILNEKRLAIDNKLPPVSVYPLGSFVQDYSFVGIGDLDKHNGRYCITPDYPTGTYAYFVTVNSTLSPIYPYILGTTYYGTPLTTTNGLGTLPAALRQDAEAINPNGADNIKHYVDDRGFVVNSNYPNASPVTYRQYEESINETKRRIKIISPSVVSVLLQNLAELI